MKHKLEATKLGTVIGESNGGDEIEICKIVFVNFKSNGKYPSLTDGDITVDYENGVIVYYDDEGDVVKQVSMFELANV